jgi:hypothetical protein
MKRNVNVFIGVVLCAVLCGCFVWLSTVSEDDAWSPNEIYNEIVQKSSYSSSYTNATFSASSGDGLALSMGSSSLSRARRSVSYAGAHGGAVTTPLTSNLSPLTYTGATAGAGMHLTSNAQLKSFGGGGNAVAMGGQSSVSNRPSTMAGGAGVAMSISSPITYTAARTNNVALADPATTSSDELMAVMAANNAIGGYTSSFYGSSLQGTYGQYAGVYGSSSSTSWGIGGRRNIGGGITSNYYGWLGNDDFWGAGCDNWGNGSDAVTEELLKELYVNATGDTDFSNEEAWEAFLYWFESQQTEENFKWHWLPLSDAIPFLILLCALWAWVVYRRNKSMATCK